jgi:hypothetical protein
MRSVLAMGVLLIAASSASWCAAQATSDPALHKRGTANSQTNSQDQSGPDQVAGQIAAKGKEWSSLPDDASGEYQLDEKGSMVEITIEGGKLSGYVSKILDEETVLTYFFAHAAVHGDQVAFATKQVHGIWYSFDGEIVRGEGRASSELGFYRLKGDWTTHNDTRKSESTVSFKSTPRLGVVR